MPSATSIFHANLLHLCETHKLFCQYLEHLLMAASDSQVDILLMLFGKIRISFLNKLLLFVKAFKNQTADGDYSRWKSLDHFYQVIIVYQLNLAKFKFNLAKSKTSFIKHFSFHSRKTMLKSIKHSCLKDGNSPSVKTQG